MGEKLSFFARHVRKHDFRASGGGFYYDRTLVTPNIIKSAFRTADELKLQCIGFDYVVDKRTGTGKIIEMCYGFDFKAIYDAEGYWDRHGVWYDENVNVQFEILNILYDKKPMKQMDTAAGDCNGI